MSSWIDCTGYTLSITSMATVKTAISVPTDVMSHVERYAKRHGLSRSEVFARAARQFIGDQSGRALTSAYDRVHGNQKVADEQRLAAKWSRSSLAKLMEENPW